MRVRELPILFNDEMVQALLTGRKTCTRRAIKLPDKMTGRPIGKSGDSSNPLGFFYPGGIKRPPYQPGDILYVRETWSEIKNADGSHKKYVYKASDQYPFGESRYIIKFNWKPSIHMPKKAARIWLKVTDVRVERLQDITEDGAKEEGANFKNGKNVGLEEKMRRTAIERFAEIWNSTIKKTDIDRYGWDANPWVWVIEFEWCEKPGKE
ncbi:MAG TPA: hypothetical protein DHW28_04995 [Lachnospiraceae bacterium]|nr:hypothetical protein [Lachnospiraceae bacterium]